MRPIPTRSSVPPSSRTERGSNGATAWKTEFHFGTEGREGRKECTNTEPDWLAPSPPPRILSELRALRDLMFKVFSPHVRGRRYTLERTERAQRGDSLENRIPFWNRRTRRTQRVHKYRARLVGSLASPSDSLRTSRPSRSYVQGFLPPCSRSPVPPSSATSALNGATTWKTEFHFGTEGREGREECTNTEPDRLASLASPRIFSDLRALRDLMFKVFSPHASDSDLRQLGKPNSILEQKVAKDAKSAQIPSPIGWRPSPPLGFSPNFAPFAILCSRFSPPMRPIPTCDSLENRIPFWNRRARRTQRVHNYRARSVGVPRLPSDFLGTSRPSRYYVQGFLPPCSRSSVPPSSAPSALNGAITWKTEFHFGTEGREGRKECTNTEPDRLASLASPRIFSELRALRDLMFKVFSPHVRGFPARLARASEIRSASRTTCTFNSRSSLPPTRLPLCPCGSLLPMLKGCLRRRERGATFHRRA